MPKGSRCYRLGSCLHEPILKTLFSDLLKKRNYCSRTHNSWQTNIYSHMDPLQVSSGPPLGYNVNNPTFEMRLQLYIVECLKDLVATALVRVFTNQFSKLFSQIF